MENISTLSDEALIEACRKDHDLFGEVITRYEDKLTRYIKRRTDVREEELADILQDIFIKIYTHMNSFDTNLTFSSWAYRIAHNEVISSFRKSRVRNHLHLDEGEEEALIHFIKEEATQERDYERKELAERIREAVDELDDTSKDMIVLRFFEEKSYEEISDIMKVPTGTVSTTLHRAKKTLRNRLSVL